MIKRKFGNSLKTKDHVSQINEILAKIVCHNICVLIQESYELGFELEVDKYARLLPAHINSSF